MKNVIRILVLLCAAISPIDNKAFAGNEQEGGAPAVAWSRDHRDTKTNACQRLAAPAVIPGRAGSIYRGPVAWQKV